MTTTTIKKQYDDLRGNEHVSNDDLRSLTDGLAYDLACISCSDSPHGASHLVKTVRDQTCGGLVTDRLLRVCPECLNRLIDMRNVTSAISVRDNIGQLTIGYEQLANLCISRSTLVEHSDD